VSLACILSVVGVMVFGLGFLAFVLVGVVIALAVFAMR
jgi:hypothetical protein